MLGLGDLLFYGLVLLQPVGVIGLFGVATRMSHGHMATSVLIAMVAMMITAVSYGRMAALYPSAGSAYTYVGRGLNPHLGFLAGWAMLLDYLIIPIVNVIYGALSAERLVPAIPYWGWALIIGLGMTLLNVRGIRATARANQVLMAAMVVVAVAFVVAAVRYLFQTAGWSGLVSLAPFYNPATFNFRDVCTATSFAAAAYVGFDGITTLAEDAINPKRTVPLATVLVCLVTGLTAILLAYLAQRVAPDSERFTDVETMFMDIAHMVGGSWLLSAIAVVMAVTCFGSGLTSQVGAARLLYGMGRDNVLPRAVFGRLDRHNSPALNIWLIGAAALAGAVRAELRTGHRADQLRGLPGLHGRERRGHPHVLVQPTPGLSPPMADRPRGTRAGVLVLLLDLVEPAEAGPNRGWDLVCRGRAVCRNPDSRIPPPPCHARLQRRLRTLLRPALPMNRSAANRPANSAGTAVFAVERGSLATLVSIEQSDLRR